MFNVWLHITGSEPGNSKLNKHNDVVRNGADFDVNLESSEGTTGLRKIYENDKLKNFEPMEQLLSDINFTSVIITNDEYTASKKLEGNSKSGYSGTKEGGSQVKKFVSNKGEDSIFGTVDFMSTIINQDEYSVSKLPFGQVTSDPNQISQELSENLDAGGAEKQFKLPEESTCPAENGPSTSMDSVIEAGNAKLAKVSFHLDQKDATSSSRNVIDESQVEIVVHSSQAKGKSALRTSGEKKAARSVTWADEKPNGLAGGNLCEFREFKNTKDDPSTSKGKEAWEDDDSQRFSSAEACAMALIQAAEAVASGQSDANDAGMNLHLIYLFI